MEGRNEYEMITRLAMEGVVYIVKLTGQGAAHMAAFLAAAVKSSTSQEKSAGRESLKKLLSSGKELRCFTLSEDMIKDFAKEAKRYGIVYSMIKRNDTDKENGTFDVMVKSEDAVRLNRILERLNVATVAVDVTSENESSNVNNRASNDSYTNELSDARAFVTRCMAPEKNPMLAAEQDNLSAAFSKKAELPVEQRNSVVEEMEILNKSIQGNQDSKNNEFTKLVQQIFENKYEDLQQGTNNFVVNPYQRKAKDKGHDFIEDIANELANVLDNRGRGEANARS